MIIPLIFKGYDPGQKKMRVTEDKRIYSLVQKYLRRESTPEELHGAISLFKDPGQEEKIGHILEECWNKQDYSLSKEEDSRNLPLILRNIHRQIEPELLKLKQIRTRKLVINLSKVAAILMIGVVLGFLADRLRNPEPVWHTYITPKGSVSQMVLPDSSIVYLNSDTELKYAINGTKNHREVSLDGEAWFKVKESMDRPFVVHTSAYDIRVTGTEFNVKAYSGEQEVVTTLESGSVQILSTETFNMKSDKELVPGQQLIFSRESQTVTTRNVTTRFYTSWKDNRLIFINMSLEELFVLLERKYGIDIEVSDPSILNFHYDGTIKNESILEVMELITLTLPVKYEVSGQKIQIIAK